jgi:hypothetical protein
VRAFIRRQEQEVHPQEQQEEDAARKLGSGRRRRRRLFGRRRRRWSDAVVKAINNDAKKAKRMGDSIKKIAQKTGNFATNLVEDVGDFVCKPHSGRRRSGGTVTCDKMLVMVNKGWSSTLGAINDGASDVTNAVAVAKAGFEALEGLAADALGEIVAVAMVAVNAVVDFVDDLIDLLGGIIKVNLLPPGGASACCEKTFEINPPNNGNDDMCSVVVTTCLAVNKAKLYAQLGIINFAHPGTSSLPWAKLKVEPELSVTLAASGPACDDSFQVEFTKEVPIADVGGIAQASLQFGVSLDFEGGLRDTLTMTVPTNVEVKALIMPFGLIPALNSNGKMDAPSADMGTPQFSIAGGNSFLPKVTATATMGFTMTALEMMTIGAAASISAGMDFGQSLSAVQMDFDLTASFGLQLAIPMPFSFCPADDEDIGLDFSDVTLTALGIDVTLFHGTLTIDLGNGAASLSSARMVGSSLTSAVGVSIGGDDDEPVYDDDPSEKSGFQPIVADDDTVSGAGATTTFSVVVSPAPIAVAAGTVTTATGSDSGEGTVAMSTFAAALTAVSLVAIAGLLIMRRRLVRAMAAHQKPSSAEPSRTEAVNPLQREPEALKEAELQREPEA